MIHDVMPASGPAERNTDIDPVEPETPKQDLTTDAAPDSGFVAPASKPSARFTLPFSWPLSKRGSVVAAVVAVIVIGAGVATALAVSDRHTSNATISKISIKKPVIILKPTTVASTLSGLPVDPSVNQRPVTAAMIENSLDARPQSGLSQAGVVFEAIAEGGVTRFMALFQDTAPDNIGPIRSARPYYVAWALGFDAGYAHVGGSPDGLRTIRDNNARDLDQFYNSGAYHRISSRQAPHNVYTSVGTLQQLQIDKGYTTSKFTGFVRKAPAPAKVATAKTIDMSLSGQYYDPHYDYNPATNSYNRSENGAPQTDQNSGQQLSPQVVIALVTPFGQGELDSSGAYYSNYAVVGSGSAYIFQDGTVSIGQWSKPANTSQISFTDNAGKPIGLNPGQTWLTAVKAATGVSYAP